MLAPLHPADRHLQNLHYAVYAFQDLQMPPQLPLLAQGLIQEISLQVQ